MKPSPPHSPLDPQWTEVDMALRSLPLAQPPARLRSGVLALIAAETARQQVELPRFRLTWLDYVICLFATVMLGLIFLVTVIAPPQLPPNLRQQVQYWLLWLRYNPETIAFWVLLGLTALGSLLAAGPVLLRSTYRLR